MLVEGHNWVGEVVVLTISYSDWLDKLKSWISGIRSE